jgi:putative PIN family toxin of toxin-antitoxin system
VIVSALLLPGSTPRQALNRALSHGEILLSDAVQTEIFAVLHRKRFQRYIRLFLVAFTRAAELITVDVNLAVCRDHKDDKFLELAVSGRATHLVTGDSDLLTLNPFREVTILTPRAFLDLVSVDPAT